MILVSVEANYRPNRRNPTPRLKKTSMIWIHIVRECFGPKLVLLLLFLFGWKWRNLLNQATFCDSKLHIHILLSS